MTSDMTDDIIHLMLEISCGAGALLSLLPERTVTEWWPRVLGCACGIEQSKARKTMSHHVNVATRSCGHCNLSAELFVQTPNVS